MTAMTQAKRDEICAGLADMIRDPECPLEWNPLLMAAHGALSALQREVPDGWQLVPTQAIKFLLGEGPDDSGHWFGDGPGAREGSGAYWWRIPFREWLLSLIYDAKSLADLPGNLNQRRDTMKTGTEIVAKFERAVIEAQHKLANEANRQFVTRLRRELIAMVDSCQEQKP